MEEEETIRWRTLSTRARDEQTGGRPPTHLLQCTEEGFVWLAKYDVGDDSNTFLELLCELSHLCDPIVGAQSRRVVRLLVVVTVGVGDTRIYGEGG